MKNILLLLLVSAMFGCSSNAVEKKTPEKPENLIVIKDGVYTEYYPGKKHIKYTGGQDAEKRRNGVWKFFAENGNELSVTVYESGVREGFTVVKHANGTLHYRGEYLHDQMVGIWTTYDEKGKVVSEKDFGYPQK